MPVTVSFKTLTQTTFTLDLDENETIADVKVKVAAGRGEEYAADLQKLIYNGKILEDSQKVSEIGFETTKFVVVMLARKKVEAAPAPAQVPSPAPVAAAPVPAPAPVVAAPAAAAAPVAAADNFTAEQEQSIEAVAGMGYPRDQVIAALRAAYWNPDRAVEFLLSGIPELAADDAAVIPQDEMNEDDNNEGPGDLLALRDMPQLDEMRELVRENPEMLGAILQQLAVVNPGLVQAIQGNQQGFIDLLNEPVGTDNSGGGLPGAPRNRAAAQPRQHVIQLSPDEMAAINRIKSMGFQVSEQAIVEAYFACEKNEEAAIEFILNTMEDQ